MIVFSVQKGALTCHTVSLAAREKVDAMNARGSNYSGTVAVLSRALPGMTSADTLQSLSSFSLILILTLCDTYTNFPKYVCIITHIWLSASGLGETETHPGSCE